MPSVHGVQGRSDPKKSLASRCTRSRAIRSSKERHAGGGRTHHQYRRGWARPAGVSLGVRGYLAVNDRLETSPSEVWAVGSALARRDYRALDNGGGARRALVESAPGKSRSATFATAEMFESYARTKGEAGNAA
jgi:hypothetical protein